MSPQRIWIFPTVLLSGATLVIGAVVYGMLWREAQRLNELSRASVEEQARVVSENLGLVVAEIKTGLMDALVAFGAENASAQLQDWAERNPMVDFAFFGEEESDQSWQFETLSSDAKKEGSAQTMLFEDGGAWLRDTTAESAEVEEQDAEVRAEKVRSSNRFSQRQSIRAQNEAYRDAVQEAKAPTGNRLEKTAPEPIAKDWRIRKSDEGDHWIGTVRWSEDGAVSGVGVRLDSLLGELRKALPRAEDSPVLYQVLDADGNALISQSRGREDSKTDAFTLSLEPELPGWILRANWQVRSSTGSAFVVMTGALVAMLMGLLLLAGLWLAWQARSGHLEAARRASFVSNVSHELKTPLTTIRLFSELIQEDRAPMEKRRQYLDTIVGECRRLSRLVENVLNFSRLEEGKSALAMERQDLSSFMDKFVEARQLELDRAGIHLERTGPKGEVRAFFDPDALTQILGNLFENAFKYAGDAGWLRVAVEESERSVSITLADGGPGLDGHAARAAFEPFERGEKALTAKGSGFGLGLSIARGLAREMGGDLRLAASGGVGTVLVVTLQK